MNCIPTPRTTVTPRVMPPKPEAMAPFASYPEAYLALMLDRDAVAVRKRYEEERKRLQLGPRPVRANSSRPRQYKLGADADAERAKVFGALTRPLPISALCVIVGMNRYQIGGHLSAMQSEGLVTRTRARTPGEAKKPTLWSRTVRNSLPAEAAQ